MLLLRTRTLGHLRARTLTRWLPCIRISPAIRRNARTTRVAKPSLQLALIADSTQPIPLLWRKVKVDFDTNSVHSQREPASGAKGDIEASANLRHVLCKIGIHSDPTIHGPISCKACRKRIPETSLVVFEHERDLVAGHGLVVATSLGYDKGADDHNDAQCDDTAGVKPRSNHPSAVLVDLETFDIDVSQNGADGGHDSEDAGEDLGLESATEGVPRDH